MFSDLNYTLYLFFCLSLFLRISFNYFCTKHSLSKYNKQSFILFYFILQQLFATQAALFRDAHGPQGTLLQGVVAQTALMGAHKVPDMDLSLPITSNYLKRMRALGLAAASLEHAYQQNNNPMKSVS